MSLIEFVEAQPLQIVIVVTYLLGFIMGIVLMKYAIKKKKRKFVALRELIDKRYAQLIEGAKGYHEIVKVLDEVESNAQR